MNGAANPPKSVNALMSDLLETQADDRFRNPSDARKKAMDFLARREYGRNELIRKLEARGYDSRISSDAVARLAEEGLQDDQRFVENFIRSRISQGKGPLRIGLELSRRGLGEGLVDRILDDIEVDWCDLACQVRLKKYSSQLPGDFKEKARQMRFLQNRGFDSEQIRVAFSRQGG